MLGRGRGDALEPAQLALGRPADVLGRGRLLQLAPQLLDLGLLVVGLPELLADGLELLAQEELALPLLEVGLDVALDLGAQLEQLELAVDQHGEAAQARLEVRLLQQLLALLHRQPQRGGHQVGERGRVVQVGHRDLQLVGQVGDELDDPREDALQVAREGLDLGGALGLVGHLLHARLEEGVGLGVRPEAHPTHALDEDPHGAVGDAHHPLDDRRGADLVELLGRGLGRLGVAAHHERQQALGPVHHVVDEADRARLADRQRGDGLREHDRLLERQHRQRLGQRGDLLGLDDRLDLRALGGRLVRAHDAAPPAEMSTRRDGCLGARGRAIRRIPSSNEAVVALASTGTPSFRRRSNGPQAISAWW